MTLQLKLLCFLAISTVSYPATAEDYSYVTNDGAITITGYAGAGGNLIIPAAINGLPVKSIGDWAFLQSTDLDNVTIPDGICNIGDSAFYYCTGLSLVGIPNSVTNIGQAAFFHCTNLANLLLPNGLNTIGDCAFAQCSSLAIVTIPGSVSSFGHGVFYNCTNLIAITANTDNSFYSSLDGVLFSKDQTTLVEWPEGKGQSYSIPYGVTTIGDSAFYCCASLTNVNIPNSVTNIERFGFTSCSALSSVTLPEKLTSIGMAAFGYCYSLTSVAIPASVQLINSGAFNVCTSLKSIDVDVSNAYYSSVDGVLFDKSQTILIQYPTGRPGNYNIPGNVASIPSWAFAGAPLTSVSIPDSVTSIPNHVFAGCNFLRSVRLPVNLSDISSMAFDYCYNLTNLIIPSSVSYLGDWAFEGCWNLSEVYFSGNAPSIGQDVFNQDSKATLYYLPGDSGWTDTFGGRPAVLWNPQIQTGTLDFGVNSNRFGFTITGTKDIPIVVEASAALPSAAWMPLQNCTLTNGAIYFADPQWTKYPARLYRIRSP
jgi:Leucine Rich Repeat (LRR) protein